MTQKELTTGDKVDDFKLLSDKNQEISLHSLLGKNVVIYFYPKDDTPGCTIEAKDFSCLTDQFHLYNTIVIGISKHNVKSHEKFRDKYTLKHTLLADTDLEVIKKFSSLGEKSLYGKKYMGVLRKTFLINKDGIIHKIWPDVKVKGHAEEVLNEVKLMEK